GVIPAAALRTARPGAAVVVAGLVTHRQQPGTARGVVFLSLEDETGMANVICLPGVWERHRRMAVEASALLVYGRVERLDGAVSPARAAVGGGRVGGGGPRRGFRLALRDRGGRGRAQRPLPERPPGRPRRARCPRRDGAAADLPRHVDAQQGGHLRALGRRDL